MRKIFYIPILFFVSCSSVHDETFKIVEGNWQITKFLLVSKDTIKDESFELAGFERNNNLWFTRLNHTNEFTSSKCKFYKKLDTLKMDIINSEDNRLNGNYNVYIDTISETNESYFLQLTLDTEKTYIQAIRSKLKHYYPPQHHTRTKPK
jgi:hypothetical protein